MKTVGIITMIGNNYGNRLQNYALQEYLNKHKIDAKTIYNNVYNKKMQKNNIINIPMKTIKKIKKLYSNWKYKTIEDKRNRAFKEFNDKYIRFSEEKIENTIGLNGIEKAYDKFIVGSDQVWNPYANRNKEIDFLRFSPKEKNITYAVSFGIEELDEKFSQDYKSGIENFSHLSVRELEGKNIINKLTKKQDAEVLIDPTMLLTKEEWERVAKKPENFDELKNKKYMLNYFLGKLSKEREKEIKRIAKENDCEIINILSKDDKFYACGPSEFLYLERNAFLICTDSFHSCVFGVLFETPFVVFEREDNLVSMFSRMRNLLSKFELEDRYYKGRITSNLLKCDYNNSYKILQKEREKSRTFLQKAIDIKED